MHSGLPITRLLADVKGDDPAARERLLATIYDELYAIARRQMNREGNGCTLQPTALVNEAYMRLFGQNGKVDWDNRGHFFAAAARVMRQIRVDDARRRKRVKRGGGAKRVELRDDAAIVDTNPTEVLAVHEALECLEQEDARKAEIVMLRYFAGFTVEECSEALGVSARTINSDWRFARAWLHRKLSKSDTAFNAVDPP